jgi:hypothetical protein
LISTLSGSGVMLQAEVGDVLSFDSLRLDENGPAPAEVDVRPG